MTITDLLTLNDDDLVETAFDAWLASDDCLHWCVYDIRDTCAEDTTSDLARAHFAEWFFEWTCDAENPTGTFEDGYDDATEKRLWSLGYDFADAVFDSIEIGEEYARTLWSLPR